MLAALILPVGIWAWTAGISGPYVFDDVVTPLGDPASQSMEAWMRYLPQTLRPVTKLTYAVEAEAGLSRQPASRRVFSLVLFVLVTGLLGLLVKHLEPRSAPVGAVLLAAIWFLHPVQADSVLLLSGRTALLSAAFLLAALLALEHSRSWLSAALFVLSCLSRETALAGLLPLAVIAASRPGLPIRQALRQLAPIFLGAALVTCWMLTTPRYLQLAEFSFLGRPFWQSFISQVGAVPAGLELLFRPAQLSIDYGIPLPTKVSDPAFLLGLGLYLAAAIGVIWLRRRSRVASVGLALWLAALLPTQSFIPKLDALTNRPLSLALAGLLLVAAPLLATALDRLRGGSDKRGAPRNPSVARAGILSAGLGLAATMCLLVLLISLAAATNHRAALFQSELNLWQDAAAKSSTSPWPHMQYASLLNRAGRRQEAFEAMMVAGAIDPFSSQIAAMTRAYRPREELQ
jgi:hypothetical protein